MSNLKSLTQQEVILAQNGQIIVPKKFRELLEIHPGEKLVLNLEQKNDGSYQIVLNKPRINFSSLIGSLEHLSDKPYQDILKTLNKEEAK